MCVSRSRRLVLSPTLAIRSAARQEDAPPLDHSIECAYTASFAALCTLLWRSCSFSCFPLPFTILGEARGNPHPQHFRLQLLLPYRSLELSSPALHHRRHPFPRQNPYNQLPVSFRFLRSITMHILRHLPSPLSTSRIRLFEMISQFCPTFIIHAGAPHQHSLIITPFNCFTRRCGNLRLIALIFSDM